MYRDHTVAVVVPAYNEEKLIGPGMSFIPGMSSIPGMSFIPVIETMPEYVDHIVMVNDCSQDGTNRAVNRHLPKMNEWEEEGKMNPVAREFYVIIERDEDGYYVGEVPQLQACYSQGLTLDELMANVREVIAMRRRLCKL